MDPPEFDRSGGWRSKEVQQRNHSKRGVHRQETSIDDDTEDLHAAHRREEQNGEAEGERGHDQTPGDDRPGHGTGTVASRPSST